MALRDIPGIIPVVMLTLLILDLPVSAEKSGTLDPADILWMEMPGHFTLSADGANVVFIKSTGTDLAPPQNNGTLIFISLPARSETVLSVADESVTGYALSPNGYSVAYAAVPREGGEPSVYLVSLADRKKIRLSGTTQELAAGFAWLGSRRLVFLGAPDGSLPSAGGADVMVVDERPDPVILKTYSLHDGIIAPLSDNDDVITIWSPSPDGRYVMYKAAPDPEAWETGAAFRYAVLDTVTGREQKLFTLTEGYQDTNQFAWSPDSTMVWIERMQNGGLRYPVQYTSDLLVYSPVTMVLEEVPLGWERGLHIDIFNSDIEVNPFNGGAYVLLADGPNPKPARVARNGTGWQVTHLNGSHPGNIFALEPDRTGTTLVYEANSPVSPPQFYKARVHGNQIVDPVQITDLNPALAAKDPGSSEITSWTGARGETVTGIVRYPPGYESAKKYPLVVVIHGGPTYTDFDSWRDSWEFPYHLIMDRGAVTLSVNYHGSTNFGFDFARSIEGNGYYDLPVEDILTGIDHLAGRGIIDRSQVGVTGWSNGGILALALITRDPSLKAAVAGAGTADEIAQLATTNGIVMDKMYFPKSPYEDPGFFHAIQPIYQADKRQTPLLMMIGSEDESVVPASAYVTYRAYREGSTAPIRFIVFTGMPHHLQTRATQERKVNEELAWLDRYLFSGLLPA
jgi:dipeptidyl aminopeptidase/acylaminoacyl peptidase